MLNKLIQNVNPNKVLEVDVGAKKVKRKVFVDFSEPKLVYFIGKVSITRQLKVARAKVNQMLIERDKISTKSEGKARICFKNLAEIDINVNTKLKWLEINNESVPSIAKIKLETGELWIRIPKGTPGAKLVIKTPNSVIDLGE